MKMIERLRRNLRYCVAEQNWTQAVLAEKVGVCVQVVSDWMNGRRNPSLNHIEQMAEIFGVDPQVLFAEKIEEGRPISADRLIRVLEINFGQTSGAKVMKQLIDIQPTFSPVSSITQREEVV